MGLPGGVGGDTPVICNKTPQTEKINSVGTLTAGPHTFKGVSVSIYLLSDL